MPPPYVYNHKMAEITVLHRWRFDLRSDGRFYIVGDLDSGKRWETTQVIELKTYDNCYQILTSNANLYVLYF